MIPIRLTLLMLATIAAVQANASTVQSQAKSDPKNQEITIEFDSVSKMDAIRAIWKKVGCKTEFHGWAPQLLTVRFSGSLSKISAGKAMSALFEVNQWIEFKWNLKGNVCHIYEPQVSLSEGNIDAAGAVASLLSKVGVAYMIHLEPLQSSPRPIRISDQPISMALRQVFNQFSECKGLKVRFVEGICVVSGADQKMRGPDTRKQTFNVYAFHTSPVSILKALMAALNKDHLITKPVSIQRMDLRKTLTSYELMREALQSTGLYTYKVMGGVYLFAPSYSAVLPPQHDL